MDYVYQLLKRQYPTGEYVLLKEVSDTTGSRSRSLDYMVMGLWPSRGIYLHGIELKSYRSDWLNELKNPAKQEKHFNYCDYFWLLTDSTKQNVASIDEIPETWGWMNIVGGKLKIHKKAPKLTPEPLPRGLLAALLRRADDKQGFILQSEIQERLNQEYQRGLLGVNKGINWKENYNNLLKNVEAFEQEAGITIGKYSYIDNCRELGKIVSMIRKGGIGDYIGKLERLNSEARAIADKINQQVNDLSAATLTDKTA